MHNHEYQQLCIYVIVWKYNTYNLANELILPNDEKICVQ